MANTTFNSSCSIFNRPEFVAVAVVKSSLGGVAFLACLFGISVIALFRKWQFFTQRLVLYLIVATTLATLGMVVQRTEYGSYTHHNFCMFTAFFIQLTVWMLINAITAITVYLFLRVGWDKSTEKYEILYVLFIFALPFTFSWIPFIRQAYGRAGVWCWIRSIDLITCKPFQFGVALQLALFYVPVLVVMPLLVLLYLIVLYKLHKRRQMWKTSADKASEEIIRREVVSLLFYPVFCLVAFFFQVLNRVYNWIVPGRPVLGLWYLSAVAYPLLGLVIVLAFTLDSDTRRRLNRAHVRAAFRDCCSRRTVSDYPVEDVQESGQHGKVPYRQLKDNLEDIEKRTSKAL